MINNTQQFKKYQKTKKKIQKICLKIVFETLMVIFNRKTLSNRDEYRKFVIFSPDLPKMGKNVKISLCEYFTVNSTQAFENSSNLILTRVQILKFTTKSTQLYCKNVSIQMISYISRQIISKIALTEDQIQRKPIQFNREKCRSILFSDVKWFDQDGQNNGKNDCVYTESREAANEDLNMRIS